MSAKKATAEQVITALVGSGGIVGQAASKLGIARQTLDERIANNPEIKAAVKEGRNLLLDVAESNVVKKIKDGDDVNSRWYLERMGRERGYGNSTDVNIRLDDATIIAFIESLGGDPDKLRALGSALGIQG